MTDIRSLAPVCGPEFHKLLKCAAAGRNHNECCSRRGVPSGCMTLCSGVIVDSLLSTATSCIPFIGNIVQCLEEGRRKKEKEWFSTSKEDLFFAFSYQKSDFLGVGSLPGPVSELHATEITNSSIKLDWEAPKNGTNVTDYVVYYQKVDNTSMYETVSKLDHVS